MTLEKATLTNTVTGERIAVLFNPQEYSLVREINYAQAQIPGLSAPVLQFVSGNAQSLEMELLADSYEAQDDVRKITSKIVDLMNIQPSTHAPPPLLFAWGSLAFSCVLSRATQRFILFAASGVPVRARLQVTFTEFRNKDLEVKEIKRETADYSRFCVVVQGDTLSAIAGRVYENPKLWRPIALRNGIDDPRRLRPGLRLIVPQLPYRDPETGEVYS